MAYTHSNYASMVRLNNGKALIWNDGDTGGVSYSEIYDPATGAWALSGNRVNFTTSFDTQAAVILPDGRVFGGDEIYDPDSGTWSRISIPQKYFAGSAIALNDGRVFLLNSISKVGYGILSQNFEYQLTATGGVPPYTYSIISGPGTVSSSGLFSTSTAGTSIIQVQDSLGHQVQSTITTTP